MCTPEDVANCERAGGCPMHGTGKGSCPPGILVGKQNSPEKPCKFCGSTSVCDCPIEIYSYSGTEKCPKCSNTCIPLWNYCPQCGAKLKEGK